MLFVCCDRAFAETSIESKRIAILIANGNYPDSGLPQQSAAKDAALLADELGRDSFEVDLEKDLGRDGMRTSLDGFLAKIKPGTTALLYFNGIGIQVARQTFLIPVNAEIWSEADVEREGTSLDTIVADMNRRGAAVKIVIVDASRRNPFERRFRAYSAGLASLDAPDGTLVMYTAAPNKVGPDSTGEVSLFMNELVKELRTPNISAEDAIMHTRIGVSRASNGEQVPWFASSLVDPIFFGRTADASSPTAPPPDSAPSQAVVPVPIAPPAVPDAKAPAPVEPPPSPAPPVKATVVPPTSIAQAPIKPAPKPPPVPVKAPVTGPPGESVPGPDASGKRRSIQEQSKPPGAPPSVVAPTPSASVADVPPSAPAENKVVDTRPGKTFRDCPDCPEMTVLDAGSFLMGSGTTPFDRPPHRVTIAKPFAMARTEVTFADWDRCLAAGGCSFKPDSQGFGEGEHPVINVSWTDAKDFTAWLSKKTGHTYRLPSEAEWEYAAHGATTTAFSWGPTVGTHKANCADCGTDRESPHTLPVKGFPPNAYGLYDMAGNAAEWVEDCWNPSYRGAPKDGSAWVSGTCEQRVLRGGSFDGTAAYIKPSARFRYDADVRYWANGLRVMREIP